MTRMYVFRLSTCQPVVPSLWGCPTTLRNETLELSGGRSSATFYVSSPHVTYYRGLRVDRHATFNSSFRH